MPEKTDDKSKGHPPQLILDLGFRPAFNREDFIVAPCNAHAVAEIDSWPNWHGSMLSLSGPPGSGKSHLAQVWCQKSGAQSCAAEDLTLENLPSLLSTDAVVIEDGENIKDEKALLHLFNLVLQEKAFLLLTGAEPPARWQIDLADLASRVSSIPVVTLTHPGDDILRAVLSKLFMDRQLEMPQNLAEYLLMRMERSFAAARQIVAALDQASMAQKRRLSVSLAREVLDSLSLSWEGSQD